MTRLTECKISDKVELLYAKTVLKNLLKHHPCADPNFLDFAVMELGTNLLKHAKQGYVWFLVCRGNLAVAALDYGPGICDIGQAVQQGHSSLENSLGLGLYSLGQHSGYTCDILSLPHTHGQLVTGTIVLIQELIPASTPIINFSLPLFDTPYNGDFYTPKGRYHFLGDVSGHGKKASETAQDVITFFLNHSVSTLTINDFFTALHDHIKIHHERSLAVCLVEETARQWTISGLGNIYVHTLSPRGLKNFHLPDGIIGEALRPCRPFPILRDSDHTLLITTDGIDPLRLQHMSRFYHHLTPEAFVLGVIFFAGLNDDRSVLLFYPPQKDKT